MNRNPEPRGGSWVATVLILLTCGLVAAVLVPRSAANHGWAYAGAIIAVGLGMGVSQASRSVGRSRRLKRQVNPTRRTVTSAPTVSGQDDARRMGAEDQATLRRMRRLRHPEDWSPRAIVAVKVAAYVLLVAFLIGLLAVVIARGDQGFGVG
jgi:hypothetical protein